ncbi:TonB-dependent receptor [Rhizobium sp. CFBP 8762]|uniref:TonB-dependent receptor n=1 Tax=Rhizobium sp. CFBP 8762 TaxID=2775279 RepID=UPI00177D0EB8|nr:TonB-dependent receptor [Rhizobium sp. CFBP 8762]MBD8553389.1 TonB-dependent receptor [Rhizobium sp. CFBP 8762]
MQHRNLSLRPLISGAAVTAGVAMTASALPHAAQAQTSSAAKPTTSTPDAAALEAIKVTGASSPSNTLNASPQISRLPATIKETPRVVNVVTSDIIEQQRVTTLEQALRNVPGITLSSGEGNGGQSGDQFRIRGFQSRGDTYIDGLRDFGVYTRDSFNTESVQVFKGPTTDNFGIGNISGAINQTSKPARLEKFVDVEQSVGVGPVFRTTVDVNQQIDDTTAVRVNGVGHWENVADRDHVKTNRQGVALDLGLGIDTGTEWHLNYKFLRGDGVPDFGIPFAPLTAGGLSQPITEYGYDRSNSFVRSTDRDDTRLNVLSSTFTHDLDNGIKIYNDTRYTNYDRDFSSTNPAICGVFVPGVDEAIGYGAGGGVTYLQDGYGVQNILGARFAGELGGVRNEANIGIDVSHQKDKRVMGNWGATRPGNQRLYNRQFDYPLAVVSYPDLGKREGSATNVGMFINDRVWLTDEFSVLGAVRYDYFKSKYSFNNPATPGGSQKDTDFSPSLSLIYEFTPQTSVYGTWSRSHKPIGTDVAAVVNIGAGLYEVPANGLHFEPEQTDLYEIGVKSDILDGRVGLTAAAFQIKKSNSYAVDPASGELLGGFLEADLGRRIRGIELGATGNVTDAWNVSANYAYLSGKFTRSNVRSEAVGKEVTNMPNHAFNLWTSYTIGEDLVAALPGKFTVGGGVQYASAYWSDPANTAKVPHSVSLDAMVGYEQDKFKVNLNAYNLTDHVNYSAAFNGARAVPTSGRTFMLTVGAKF